jgi:hypothetical protein
MESTDLKRLITSVLKKQRGTMDREMMDPAREWLFGVLIALVLVLVGGLYSYLFYQRVINSDIVVSSDDASSTIYNSQKITEAISKYQQKRDFFDSIGQGTKNETTKNVSEVVLESEISTTTTGAILEAVDTVPRAPTLSPF